MPQEADSIDAPSDIVSAAAPEQTQKREHDLREREVVAREREVAAKEKETARSRWLNPMVIGLFAAAVGLIGNVVVARVNNQNTQKVETLHLQSSLVLEAIKTGSADAACKNLVFFVGLGLIDDSSKIIRKQCSSAPQGAPSLPAGIPAEAGERMGHTFTGMVWDADGGNAISGAKVSMPDIGVTAITNVRGEYILPLPSGLTLVQLRAEKDGYELYEYQLVPAPYTSISLHRKK